MNKEEVLDEVNVIYERLSHPEDCENGVYSFRDGNYLEALEILIDFYETGLIEELEKIKREIINCFSQENDIDSDPYNHALDIAISIVHDHITELKGE